MGISDTIADFINELLKDDTSLELQRSELASRFGCVPSQINYVISTRFSPERGYIVESRRGGGGYIRIIRVQPDSGQLLMHTLNAVGDTIDLRSASALVMNAAAAGAVGEKEARLILAGISDNALRPLAPELRDEARASILKQMLLRIIG